MEILLDFPPLSGKRSILIFAGTHYGCAKPSRTAGNGKRNSQVRQDGVALHFFS
jgi:hypothetical protein